MASTRELWVILRGRDEASRLVHSFARNVRDAGNAVRAAQLQSQAASIRQQAQLLKTNGAVAEQIRIMNQHVLGLDKQARGYTLAAAQAREHRDTVMRVTGATNGQIATINRHIQVLDRRAAVLRAQAAIERNQIQTTVAGLDAQVRAMNTYAASLDSQARKLRDADKAALNHVRTMQRMSIGFQQLSDVALGFTFALGAAAAASVVFMAKATKSFVDYEKSVRLTATQVDGFAGNLEELGDVGIRVADTIGVHFQDIQPALFDIFSSMEVGVKDAETLLKAFSKGAVAGQVEIQDVSRATIGLMNAFNLPVRDVNRLLDIQFQLVQEGIGTYEEWNQRIGLVTPSAVRAGQSVEMMGAALAVATRMGLSAARSGTSVARAMDAMSHPKAVKNMEQLGIKVRDARGKFLPMNVVLRQFRDVLRKMPEKDRVAAILDVFKGAGGTIEARRFLQNMLLGKQSIELFDEVLGEMQNSAGSMDKAYGTMAESIAVKTELLKNKWEILKIGVGQALVPSVLQLVEALSRALDWFNRLPDSTKKIITQFLLWGTVAAAIGAVLFGIVAVIGFVAAAFVTAGTVILVVIGVLAALAIGAVAAGAAFIKLWKNSENFRELISEIADKVVDAKNVIVDLAQKGAAAFNDKLRPALEELWNTIDTKVIPVIKDLVTRVADNLLPKLKEAGEVFINRIKPAMDEVARFIKDDLIPAIDELSAVYEENKTLIDPLIKGLGSLLVVGALVGGMIIASIVVPLRVLGFAIKVTVAWVGLLIEHFRNIDDIALMVGRALARAYNAFVNFRARVLAFIIKLIIDIVMWFAGLPGRIARALGNLPSVVGAVFQRMGSGILSSIASTFSRATGSAGTGSNNIVNRVISVLRNLPGRAASAIAALPLTIGRVLSNTAGIAYNAGSRIIGSLIRGLTSRLGELRNIANTIAGIIANVLPGSPVKSGPLRVLNRGRAGKEIVRMIIKGMESENMSLQNAFKNVANPLLRPTPPPSYTPDSPPPGPGSSSSEGKTVNNQFYITTQEIDPRKHAADLGWELAGRM